MANTDFDDSEDFGDTNFDPNDEVRLVCLKIINIYLD